MIELLLGLMIGVAAGMGSWRRDSQGHNFHEQGFNSHSVQVNARIRGGAEVNIEDFPCVVFLLITLVSKTSDKKSQVGCGGTIIGDYWVLTAAHCLETKEKTLEEALVRAGSSLKSSGGVELVADQHIIYEKYDPGAVANDIALLKVREPFPFDGWKIAPANLALKGQQTPIGSTVTIVGWGRTKMSGGTSPYLLKATMKVIACPRESTICALAPKADKLFGKLGKVCVEDLHECGRKSPPRLPACIQICRSLEDFLADNYPNMSSGLQGDSGGPLFAEDVVVGVFSGYYEGSLPQLPNSHSRVAFYRDWIQEKTGI